ncbi:hypothetical protein F5Y14DRAFT_460086 [Nemania sp. NC0429]|nr:hypothetical protein F5Y14DRAFT_460086 [Nemania sp. NC0429]
MSNKDIAAEVDAKMTPGDVKFFAAMFKYLPKNIEIDWDEFAKEMGFKDGKIAKVRCRQIRAKLDPETPTKTPTKRAATAKDLSLDDPETPTKATPKALKPANEGNKVTKGGRKGKGKQPKSEPKVANDDDDDDGEEKVKAEAVADADEKEAH